MIRRLKIFIVIFISSNLLGKTMERLENAENVGG